MKMDIYSAINHGDEMDIGRVHAYKMQLIAALVNIQQLREQVFASAPIIRSTGDLIEQIRRETEEIAEMEAEANE